MPFVFGLVGMLAGGAIVYLYYQKIEAKYDEILGYLKAGENKVAASVSEIRKAL